MNIRKLALQAIEKILYKNKKIDFDFQNCIAQLSVTESQYVPYQYVYFEYSNDLFVSIYGNRNLFCIEVFCWIFQPLLPCTAEGFGCGKWFCGRDAFWTESGKSIYSRR